MQTWPRRTILLSLIGCLLAACSSGQVGAITYNIAVRGEDNQVTVEREANQSESIYIVRVESAQGIGQATLAWWGSLPPHPLEFQVHTSGLESFSLTWASQTVNVRVNSTDHSVTESLQTKHQDETTITNDSPYWIKVQMPSQEGNAFLLTAPVAFIQDAPPIWGLSWIDFYR